MFYFAAATAICFVVWSVCMSLCHIKWHGNISFTVPGLPQMAMVAECSMVTVAGMVAYGFGFYASALAVSVGCFIGLAILMFRLNQQFWGTKAALAQVAFGIPFCMFTQWLISFV